MKHALLLFFLTFGLLAFGQISPVKTERLKVSANHRYLVTESGHPFFWLGDTGWELFHRLNYADAKKYLSKRAEQGFTVIQAVVLAEFDGLHVPNANGHLPLANDDPTRPVESYFRFVDSVIDLAQGLGIYIALLPTWGDKVYKDKWGTGPEIFNTDNAKVYGQWIGNRYKDRSNIIWVMGGDRNPRNESDIQIWRSLAAGVVAGCGGQDCALMTFHPQPSETSSSSTWFHEDDWLDFNMLQTGHCADVPVWEKIKHDYDKKTVKPVLNGEAVYEEHPLCFNAKDNGYTSAYDSRKAAWLSVFAGSMGYTYGCHSIWQFYTPGRIAVNGPLRFWYVSMELPAASQMHYLKNLIQKFPAADRRPAQDVIVDANEGTRRIQAIGGKDFLLVYSAAGESFAMNLKKFQTKTFKAFWYDPRTGAKFLIPAVNNTGIKSFRPPSKGADNDWVLVLFDATKKYISSEP